MAAPQAEYTPNGQGQVLVPDDAEARSRTPVGHPYERSEYVEYVQPITEGGLTTRQLARIMHGPRKMDEKSIYSMH